MATPSPVNASEVVTKVDPRVMRIVIELRRRLEALYGDRLERVILFGSQARGDADAESDIDVLVVLCGEVDPIREIDRSSNDVWQLSLQHDIAISRVFVSLERFQTELSPFLMNARREAVAL